ncbi:MAG TPA: cytochrome c-type biogenesis protein [Acidimicrobiia bacterium]
MIRRLAPWIALGAVVTVTLAVVVWPDGGDPSPRARARALAEEFRCPECQGLSVADSSAPTARAMRADIRERIAAGQSDEEIRQSMVDRFGESVLLRPQGGGIGFVVWGLPVIAVVLGAGGLAYALWRWRRQPAAHATAADEALVERARS